MRPSHQNPSAASALDRAASDADRAGFRPVALPALAAAMRVAQDAAKAVAREATPLRDNARFLHEDAPLV